MNAKLVVILAINGVMFIVASFVEYNYYATHEHQLPHHFSATTYAARTDTAPYRHAEERPLLAGLAQMRKLGKSSWFAPLSTAAHDSTIPGDGSGGELSNAAVIVFAYNRTSYLEKTLESMAGLAGLDQVSLYVSQDGNFTGVRDLVQRMRERLSPPHTRAFQYWQRERVAQLRPNQAGHAWLSQHYKWGLDRVFLERGHSHAIIVEDDMLFSPDFLHFFKATAVLLERDPSLWCISTWNDNGLSTFDWDSKRMLRTSYFPGLGWMMRRQLWHEIGPDWPLQSWDHWMRLNTTAKGRECIAPEVNRNLNIGEKGANMDRRIFRKYLSIMSWNRQLISDYGNLSYLVQPQYSTHMQQMVARAEHWQWRQQDIDHLDQRKVFLLTYKSEEYPELAKSFKIWPFPRAHHKHVAVIPYRNSSFLLADARFSPLLPPALKVLPSANLTAVPAERQQPCDTACLKWGLPLAYVAAA
ncbi:hypothetical protein WJX72_007588 [[Myrmecia] bisecta]|uniref:Alpha-1,3-mannosyl-glycoprotein 2-beta-N-acetylglucosaminyltransferase n=1 Tax=[Myrmecia] bisecta TaxID=41462 RepID=A0AAW1PP96_9CHLO